MEKTIRCDKCCGEIKYKSDIVVVQEGIIGIAAYHEDCYVRISKGIKGFIMSSPLNSARGIFSLVAANIIYIILLFAVLDSDLSGFYILLVLLFAFYADFHYYLGWYHYLRHFK